jgi:hypothetical protein
MQWLNNKITFLFFFLYLSGGIFSCPVDTHTHRKEWKKKFLHGGFYFCVCESVGPIGCVSRASGSNPQPVRSQSHLSFSFRLFLFIFLFFPFCRRFRQIFSSRRNPTRNLYYYYSFWSDSSIENHWAIPPIHLPQLLSKVVPPTTPTPPFTHSEENIWRIGCLWLFILCCLIFVSFTKHIEISNFFKYY